MAQKLSPETSSDFVETFSNIGLGSSSPDWRDTKTVSQCVVHLCLSSHLSDVTLKFSKEPSVKLPAHKFVLGMRSRVFEAMLYGKQGVTNKTMTIDDIGSNTMQELIRYIYTDKAQINGKNVLNCLYAAKLYSVAGLATKCCEFLEESISVGNVCTIYEQAIQYSMKELQTKCFNFMLENAIDVFKSGGFLKISKPTLVNLLQSDDLAADEEIIFTAASAWAEAQCVLNKMSASPDNKRTVLGEALYQVRFPIMTIENFAKLVSPERILTSDEEIMLYQYLASNGTTQLSNFVSRKRGQRKTNIVTIDLNDYDNPNSLNNCLGYFLTMNQPDYKFVPLMCKAIACKFADKVKRVDFQYSAMGFVKFTVKEGQLVFDPPIPIYLEENIVFFTNETTFNVQPLKEQNLELSTRGHYQTRVNNNDLIITSLPVGLTSISFAK